MDYPQKGFWPPTIPVYRQRPERYRYANRRAFTKLENYRVPTWKELSILAIAIEDLTHPSEPEPWPVDVDLFRQ